MKISDFLENINLHLGKEVNIEGWLVATGYFSYLVGDREKENNQECTPAILFSGDQLLKFIESLSQPLPVFAGSCVLYQCNANINGIIRRSGLSIAPFCMSYIFEVTFFNDEGEGETFTINEKLRDVYLSPLSNVTVDQLKGLKKYFPNETVLGLKEKLENAKGDILLKAAATSSEIEEIKSQLNTLGLEKPIVKSTRVTPFGDLDL